MKIYCTGMYFSVEKPMPDNRRRALRCYVLYSIPVHGTICLSDLDWKCFVQKFGQREGEGIRRIAFKDASTNRVNILQFKQVE